MSRKGHAVREVEELAFLVDVQHRLALFPGTKDEVAAKKARIERACACDVMVMSLPGDLTESEANQMFVTRRVPKRILARL